MPFSKSDIGKLSNDLLNVGVKLLVLSQFWRK